VQVNPPVIQAVPQFVTPNPGLHEVTEVGDEHVAILPPHGVQVPALL